MKRKAKENGKKLTEDLKTFERLPAKTREPLLLGDKAEKAIGKERAKLNDKIKRRSEPG